MKVEERRSMVTGEEAADRLEGEPEGSIRKIRLGEKEVILVGTAHIAENSIRDVRRVLEEEAPEAVCVELDRDRYRSLTERKDWRSMNIREVLKKKQGFLLLSNLLLSSFQRRLGKEFGTLPGSELLEAVRLAEEKNIPVHLSDRPVQVTLMRAWRKSGFWNKNRLLAAMITAFFSKESVDEEQIEKLRAGGVQEEIMEGLAQELPSVKSVLIDERDDFLALKIFKAPEKKIAAVLGAGHVPGVKERLRQLEAGTFKGREEDYLSIPPSGSWGKILGWSIPALLLVFTLTGFMKLGAKTGFSILNTWVLYNGVLTALGGILALAHPLTILAGFIAAPITSLTPVVGAGMVTALVQSVLVKPRISDLENLLDDAAGWKGWYRNRVIHILLVMLLTGLGSSIGSFLSISKIGFMIK